MHIQIAFLEEIMRFQGEFMYYISFAYI